MTRKYCRVSIASIGPIPDRIDDEAEEDVTDHEAGNGVTSGGNGGLEPAEGDELEGGELDSDEPDPVAAEQGPISPE